MKKIFYFIAFLAVMTVLSSCSSSFTTVATPDPMKPMLITSGDLPTKKYQVIGFVESSVSRAGFGFPNETEFSRMKTEALNRGLVAKAEQIGADAVINISFSTTSRSSYIFFQETFVFFTGTAIKFIP